MEDAEDYDASDTAVLPRIPNPIVCLSSGDMLIFHLTINHTGTADFISICAVYLSQWTGLFLLCFKHIKLVLTRLYIR